MKLKVFALGGVKTDAKKGDKLGKLKVFVLGFVACIFTCVFAFVFAYVFSFAFAFVTHAVCYFSTTGKRYDAAQPASRR